MNVNIDDPNLFRPPSNEWGDLRRREARLAGIQLLERLRAAGYTEEKIDEVEEILRDGGMFGGKV